MLGSRNLNTHLTENINDKVTETKLCITGENVQGNTEISNKSNGLQNREMHTWHHLHAPPICKAMEGDRHTDAVMPRSNSTKHSWSLVAE